MWPRRKCIRNLAGGGVANPELIFIDVSIVNAIDLEPTEDIIAAVGAASTGGGRIVVGFAAESESLISHAESKLREKGMDLIIANDITRTDAGFDVETNAATIIRRDGSRTELPLQSKFELAERLLDEVIRLRKLVGTPA